MTALHAAIDFTKRLLAAIEKDQVANGAAALAFYSMLALFPAAIFGLSLLPYLPIPHLQQAMFGLLHQLLPDQSANMFTKTVTDVISVRNSRLLSFGLLFAIWSASSGVYAMMQQLNVVYGVEEARPFWKARAVTLLLMLIFFALGVVTFAVVIFGGVLQDWLVDRLGWSGAFSVSFAVFRWVVICLALLAAFALVYRIGPNTERPFRMFRLGNVIATAGFLVASFGFRVYVTNFASYDAMYGSLGAAIVLLLWLFIVGWVVLVGGEINALREDRQTTKASAARSERASTLAMHRGGTHDSATY